MISGMIWTIIASFIIQDRATWGRLVDFRWWVCITGPIIGLIAYYISRWSYKKRMLVRVIWSIISLYLASGIYGLILGILDLSHPLRSINEVPYSFIGMPVPIWWGLTFIPIFWPLFGFSYFNHWLISRHVTDSININQHDEINPK